MKHLKKFTDIESLNLYKNSTDYKRPNVSLVNHKIENYDRVQYNMLDILYANSLTGKKIVTSEILDSSLGYIPIGICIIPSWFFGKFEKARFMSLGIVSTTSVLSEDGGMCNDNGTSDLYNFFGQKGVDTVLPNITKTYKGSTSHWGDMTALYITGTSNKIPSITTLDENNNLIWNLQELGDINAYSATTINGKENTQKLIELATNETDWQTINSLSTNKGEGYSPAACTCWRYHPTGTQQGDWYLGASGEMSFLCQYKTEIVNKIHQLHNQGSYKVLTAPNGNLHSYSFEHICTSTENDSNQNVRIDLKYGRLDVRQKDASSVVIPIMQY